MQPTWSFEVRNRCFSLQEVCSDASQEKLSLEVVTALCLAFKISISKAFDQVIETQHKVLMESIISLLNPCHEDQEQRHARRGLRWKVLACRRKIVHPVPISTHPTYSM